jgi:hypothetical protein
MTLAPRSHPQIYASSPGSAQQEQNSHLETGRLRMRNRLAGKMVVQVRGYKLIYLELVAEAKFPDLAVVSLD